MRRTSILFVALAAVSPAKSFSQEVPTPDVLLDSWMEAVTKASSVTYRLTGTYRVVESEGKLLQEGSYDILESGKRFRWEFKLPENYYLASFDGEDWYNKGRRKDSSGKMVEQGNILLDPVKALDGDPRELIVSGLVPIFPINLPQLVGQPVRIKLDQPLAKSLKKIQNDLKVEAVTEGQQKLYKVTIAASAVSRSLAMPDTIWFKVIEGKFLPVRVQNKPDRPASFGQIVRLSDFTTIEGVPVPLKLDNEVVQSDQTGNLRSVGHTVSTVKVQVLTEAALGKKDFSATFSPDALVYREKEGIASKDSERQTGANITWYIAGGVLVLVGIVFAARSRWKKRS